MIFCICVFFKSSTGTLELTLYESEFFELILLSVGFFFEIKIMYLTGLVAVNLELLENCD